MTDGRKPLPAKAEMVLVPCPFCGGTEALKLSPTCDRRTPYNAADRAFPSIRCMTCYAEAIGKDWDASCKTAVEAWNTRAALTAAPKATETPGLREAYLEGHGDALLTSMAAEDAWEISTARAALSATPQPLPGLREVLETLRRHILGLDKRSFILVPAGNGVRAVKDSCGSWLNYYEVGNVIEAALEQAAQPVTPQPVAHGLRGTLEKIAKRSTCIEMEEDKAADWASFVDFHDEIIEEARAALSATPQPVAFSDNAAGRDEVVGVVPEHCTAASLSFDGGTLTVHKDGRAEIVVSEEHFSCEDDRGEGPDGPEGSIHWIARLGIGETQALKAFLNGAPYDADEALRAEQEEHLKTATALSAECAAHEQTRRELARLRKLATDRRYMLEAYRSMLGPVGLKVAKGWEDAGVQRFHTSWGPDAASMTGEQRAQCILDFEAAPRRRVLNIDTGELAPEDDARAAARSSREEGK